MSPIPEQSESGKESFVSTLAGFAKTVVKELREDADERMKALSTGKDQKLKAVEEDLSTIQKLFSGETDVVADKSELALDVERATAFVNLVRSLLGLTPLGSDEAVDLDRDLQIDEQHGNVLRTGGKETRYGDLDFSRFKDVGERLIHAGESAIGFKERLGSKSCWDWIKGVYDKAGVKMGKVVYQDTMNGKGAQGGFDFTYLVPGAWIYYYNGNAYGGEHSAILKEYNPATGMATVLSYTGGTQGTPREHQVKLNPPDGELMGRITHIRLPGEPETFNT